MSENKRFIISGDRSISDHHKKRLYDLSNFDGVISVNECMNELNDENEQLKSENNKLIVDKNGIQCEYEWLKEKNEQLKQQINELQFNKALGQQEYQKRVLND